MIPSEYKTEIINSSIYFIKALTKAYGSDEGMQLWGTIADTLDPSIKGEVFMAMLVGDYKSTIVVSSYTKYSNRVGMIKAVRTVANYNLKEAKDAVDGLDLGKTMILKCNPQSYEAYVDILRQAGFNI